MLIRARNETRSRPRASLWPPLLILLLCGPAAAQGVPWLARPLLPPSAAPGGAAFTLTARGAGFTTGAVVRWNGTALPTKFVSAGEIQAAVAAAEISSPGTASVTVANPGVGAASNSVLFPVGQARTGVFYANSPGDPVLAEPFAVGDFYGNGPTEVATAGDFLAEGQPSIIAPYLGQPDGSFSAGPQSPWPPGSGGAGLLGDFNGDGKLDVLLLDEPAGGGQLTGITVLLGDGNGAFTTGPTTQVSVPAAVGGVDIGDFNHDGKLDFVIQEGESGPIQVFFGNGDGTFTPGPKTVLPAAVVGAANGHTFQLVDGGVGDFNNDGNLDLVVTDGYYLQVMLGHGDGTFSPGPGTPVSAGVLGNNVVVGDFNGDGDPDIAAPNAGTSSLPPLEIYAGHGDGTFTAVPNCCGAPAFGINAEQVVAGDFNDDGRPDLAVVAQDSQSGYPFDYLEVFLGNGDGTFTPTDFSEVLPNPINGLWLTDANQDGRLDFVARANGDLWGLVQTPPSAQAPGFSLSASQPSVTVTPGGSVTDNINLASLNGFIGSLSPIACAGAPANATCVMSYQPPNMLVPTAAGAFPLVITTQAPTKVSLTAPSFSAGGRGGWRAGWGLGLAGLMLLGGAGIFAGGGRRLHAGLAAFALGVGLLSGCGGSPQSGPRYVGGTPPGKYALTVSVTAAGITHSTTIQLQVQK